MSATVTDAGVTKANDPAFPGHPRGLAYLAFAEAWERFSYYGMQTLLVLCMVRQLPHPGHVERMPGTPRWLLHAGLVSGAALLLLVAWRIFGHVLAPTRPDWLHPPRTADRQRMSSSGCGSFASSSSPNLASM
jgi:hypothetical protein